MAQVSKAALSGLNNSSFPNNNTGYITPELLRTFNSDMIDSTVNQTVYDSASAAVNNSISALNTFTSSQQPSFTAINAFTASQIVINAGVNGFTQSAQLELDSLSAWTGSWEAWTSSINEIRNGGIFQGYSTRLYFGNLLSASIVANVGGPIASINVLSDGTKLNTASFDSFVTGNNTWTASAKVSLTNINAFTASNGNTSLNAYTQSQNIINASVTASLSELLALSSSLSGGYATQGELDASASALQANIDTKLSTASFNAYTQSTNEVIATLATTASVNNLSSSVSGTISALSTSIQITDNAQTARINGLASFTGSYATTGSNTFIGNEIITGSITITGSAYGNVVSASIASNTASIDLAAGNYFTLRLAPNTNTRINVINPQPGVTATLIIDTDATSSVSFSANIKQPSASFYVPSPSGNVDILSFTAATTGTVYVVPAFAFV